MDLADPVVALQAACEGFFPGLLGLRVVSAAPERVVAEMEARPELRTVPGVTHGGALMGLADALGGMATALNLRPGQGTTTIESKTNFFAPARTGTTITAECVPLHRGRRTMVWQTTIRDGEGRLLALVTQTQLVLEEG
ncbi:MAG: PaaI family thioesterase [Dehalococcoidia bacterium]|nr:PaaI family thioesterase [Dehalococcoidia bacterium]